MADKKGDAPAAKSEAVQVVIRCRPLSSTEIANGNQKIVTMDRKTREVRVANKSEPPRIFTMDNVFDESLEQRVVYDETCRTIVDSVLKGYNGTIFAYGQTGTGKTFTMEGVEKPENLRGCIPRAFDQIFELINASQGVEFLVRASFLEIYNDNILDLLNEGKIPLELKEHPDTGVYVKDLRTEVVKTVSDLNGLLQLGKKSRKVGSTLMNRDSSRSHCLFCVYVESSEMGADGQSHIRAGKLNMVDLAGSERQKKTGAEGERIKEAANINLALSALGNVISALTSAKIGHIPYRDSKLTRLLQDSLGGNTKTVMIANIGPADYNLDETITTLRFATRAKSIKNKPKINEDPKDAMLREYQDEIAQLRAALAAQEAIDAGLPPPPGYDPTALARLGFSPNIISRTEKLPPKKVIVEKVVVKENVVGISESEVLAMQEAAEAHMRNIQEKHEKEKQEIIEIKKKMEQKADDTLSAVKEKEEALEAKRADRLAMRHKLKEMEEAVMKGNKMIDDAKRQELLIQQNKSELDRQRLERERAESELRNREEQQLNLAEMYDSLDKELAAKNAKLQKLMSKYQEVKQETEDVQAENQREREQLLDTIRELTRHIQLKDFILDHYVPREETEKVENRAYWDEERDEWLLHPTDYPALNLAIKRPGSAKVGLRRPTSDFALAHGMEGMDGGPRFRAENIIDLELDMPERTTQDYGQPAQQPYQEQYMANSDQELMAQYYQSQQQQVQGARVNSGMEAYLNQQQQLNMQQQAMRMQQQQQYGRDDRQRGRY